MTAIGSGERIVLTKWNGPLAVVMLSLTAMLWVFPALEAVHGDYRRGEQIVLGVFAAVLAVPFLWVCRRLPKVLRGMGVEIDAEGVLPFDGSRTGTIARHEVPPPQPGPNGRSRTPGRRSRCPRRTADA